MDDILVEIKSENIKGIHCLGLQDWEAIALMKGLCKALTKKYGNLDKCAESLIKKGLIEKSFKK